MIRKLLFMGVVFAIIIASCTKDNYQVDYDKAHPPVITPVNPNPTTPVIDTCTDSIKFSVQVQRIITNKCATAGCHDGNAQTNFDYAYFSSDSSSVVSRIDDAGNPMPPAGSPTLDACEKSKIKSWVKKGAPNN